MNTILDVKDLVISFENDGQMVEAVRNISFNIPVGKTVALVGESGSGKSVSALSTVGLLPTSANVSGAIKFKGKDLIQSSEKELQQVRGNEISFIFQEPMTSLNPLHTLEKQISESLLLHQNLRGSAAKKRVIELLTKVGIDDPGSRLTSYPHELSGGQRQRVGICRALIQNPDLLLVDEPTASLDPKTSRQIMRLIQELCSERGLTAIINIHDVFLAQMFSQRVIGLELGSVVYDGKPEGLTPEVLTRIYGEEDWSATIKSTDEDDDNEEELQS